MAASGDALSAGDMAASAAALSAEESSLKKVPRDPKGAGRRQEQQSIPQHEHGPWCHWSQSCFLHKARGGSVCVWEERAQALDSHDRLSVWGTITLSTRCCSNRSLKFKPASRSLVRIFIVIKLHSAAVNGNIFIKSIAS